MWQYSDSHYCVNTSRLYYRKLYVNRSKEQSMEREGLNAWNWVALICLAIIVLILVAFGGVGAFMAAAAAGEATLAVILMVTAVIMAITALIIDPHVFSNVCDVIGSGIAKLADGIGKAVNYVVQGASAGLMKGFGPLLIGGLGVVALVLLLRK